MQIVVWELVRGTSCLALRREAGSPTQKLANRGPGPVDDVVVDDGVFDGVVIVLLIVDCVVVGGVMVRAIVLLSLLMISAMLHYVVQRRQVTA